MEGSPEGWVGWQILQRQVDPYCAQAGGAAASPPEKKKSGKCEQDWRKWGEMTDKSRKEGGGEGKGKMPKECFYQMELLCDIVQSSCSTRPSRHISKNIFNYFALNKTHRKHFSVIQSLFGRFKVFWMSHVCPILYLCLSFLRMRPPRKEVLQTIASRKTTKRLVMRARRRSQNQRKT